MSKFFINCDEATTICNKSQYKEASVWELLKLSVHIFMCRTCGRYSKQNTVVTKICDKHLHKTKNANGLCEKEKEILHAEVVKKTNPDR